MKFYSNAVMAGLVAVIGLTAPVQQASAAQTTSAAAKVDDDAIESRINNSLEKSPLAPARP